MLLLFIFLVVCFLQILFYKLIDILNLKYGRLLALVFLIVGSYFILFNILAVEPPPGASKCGNGQTGAILLFALVLPAIFIISHFAYFIKRKLFNQ